MYAVLTCARKQRQDVGCALLETQQFGSAADRLTGMWRIVCTSRSEPHKCCFSLGGGRVGVYWLGNFPRRRPKRTVSHKKWMVRDDIELLFLLSWQVILVQSGLTTSTCYMYGVLVDAQGCESSNYTPASDTVDLCAPRPRSPPRFLSSSEQEFHSLQITMLLASKPRALLLGVRLSNCMTSRRTRLPHRRLFSATSLKMTVAVSRGSIGPPEGSQ